MVPTMCLRDVNFVCMPRSALSQMVGMVESVTQASEAKMEDARETVNISYPEVLVCVNLFGHLSSSGFGGVIANADCGLDLIQQAAMDYANELIKIHQFLKTQGCRLIVLTPPGFVYFTEPLKKLVFLVEKALKDTTVKFSITAPNMEINEDLRTHGFPSPCRTSTTFTHMT